MRVNAFALMAFRAWGAFRAGIARVKAGVVAAYLIRAAFGA